MKSRILVAQTSLRIRRQRRGLYAAAVKGYDAPAHKAGKRHAVSAAQQIKATGPGAKSRGGMPRMPFFAFFGVAPLAEGGIFDIHGLMDGKDFTVAYLAFFSFLEARYGTAAHLCRISSQLE